MIEVKRIGEGDPLEFEIMVRVGNGQTRHHVTMARDTCERLTAGTHTPERCIEAAFQFLLDREPKESILRRFDVTVISPVPLLRLAPNDAPAPIANRPPGLHQRGWPLQESRSLAWAMRGQTDIRQYDCRSRPRWNVDLDDN